MTEQTEPTPEQPTGRPLVVRVAQLSDVGRVRSENQDFAILSAPADEVDREMGRLLVVADGMGGHRGGATASRMAATIAKDEYFRESGEISAALTRALERANARIFAESQVNPELRGMGTTCSALVVHGRQGFLAHVGDSRIYRVRDGEIAQLTDDHSLVASMVREGLLTTAEAEVHPRRNVLQRSMGVGSEVEIDARGPFEVLPGDTFVLCSDGLHGLVKSDEIAKIAQLGIEDAARELVNLALERGAPDNVTVVVGRAEETTSEELAQWEVAAREERARSEATFLAPTEEVDVFSDQSEITTQRMIAISDEGDISDATTEPLEAVPESPAPPPPSPPPSKRPAPAPAQAAAPAKSGGGGWVLGLVIVVLLAAALAWVFYSAK